MPEDYWPAVHTGLSRVFSQLQCHLSDSPVFHFLILSSQQSNYKKSPTPTVVEKRIYGSPKILVVLEFISSHKLEFISSHSIWLCTVQVKARMMFLSSWQAQNLSEDLEKLPKYFHSISLLTNIFHKYQYMIR